MTRPLFLPVLLVALIALLGVWPQPVPAAGPAFYERLPESAPPAIVVAGSRVGFTRDFTTGRINVHLDGPLHAKHVVLLKRQGRLGTVFVSGRRTPLGNADDLRLLADVPMTGVVLFSAPVGDQALNALRGHPTVESIQLYKAGLTDAGLDALATFPKLVKISLGLEDITNAGVAKIAKLDRLTSLEIRRCARVTDEGVIGLARLKSLRILALNINERLTRRIVKPLAALEGLRRLEFSEVRLAADDFAELRRLPHLEELGVWRTGLDDEGAKHLGRITSLRWLDIGEAAITDAAVSHLKNLTELQTLYAAKTALTDRGVAELAGLRRLERLGLSSTKVTDAGVKALSALPELKFLHLDGTAVSTEEIERLCESRPKLRVFPIPQSVLERQIRERRRP
jgi:hypothetical protein